FDKVKAYGQILANQRLSPYQAIGHYFLGVAANRKGNGDQDEANRLFGLVSDPAPDAYKVKAMLSLGALVFHKKEFDSAFHYFRETARAGSLSVAGLQAVRGISILKAIEGDHTQAVEDLERILPMLKYAPPHIYFDLLNSYAVELGEVGRKHEARTIMRHVLASPLVQAYPEWRETAED